MKKYEKELRDRLANGKISKKAVKDFLKSYFEGDPECVGCPTGCKKPEECYIDIHLALFGDDGVRYDFGGSYIRDGQPHCCGKPVSDLDGREYCSVCGNEY